MGLWSLSPSSVATFALGLAGGFAAGVAVSRYASSPARDSSARARASDHDDLSKRLLQLTSSVNSLAESMHTMATAYTLQRGPRHQQQHHQHHGGHNRHDGYMTPLGDTYYDAQADDDDDDDDDEHHHNSHHNHHPHRHHHDESDANGSTAVAGYDSASAGSNGGSSGGDEEFYEAYQERVRTASNASFTSSAVPPSATATTTVTTTTTSIATTAVSKATSAAAPGDSFEAFTKRIDEMRERKEFQPVFNSLKATYESQKAAGAIDPEVMWRFARAYFDLSTTKAAGSEEKKSLVQTGFELAKEGLGLFETSAMMHKWYAILITALADFGGSKDKIQNAFIFRDHIRRAIQLNPKDGSSYHLLGRWCFEVAKLSWWEKKAAAALFGTPPESTVEEALELFLKAEDATPKFWRANPLYIGKCYFLKGDKQSARKYFEHALAPGFRVSMDDDETIAEVNKELLTV